MGFNRAGYLCCAYSVFLVGCEPDIGIVVPKVPVAVDIVEASVEPVDYSKVPTLCLGYREQIEAVADCPARRAAAMEQESSCNKFALSFDKGEGLFQFTGKTGPNLADDLCRDLGPFQPYNPIWAIPCGVRYFESLTAGYTQQEVQTGEMRFNGGYWVVWEMEQARLNGLSETLDNAKQFCGTLLYNGRKRASKWCDWNYDYFKHIERRLPKYDGYDQGKCQW